MKRNNNHFAEIIESSSTGWIAQSWQWNHFPQFGSIVTTQHQDLILCGIVHQVTTGSIDPMRSPFPYQKTEQELRKEQPHIFEFLKTTFSCLNLGYIEDEKAHYLIPPKPASIHAFVTPASDDFMQLFFAKPNYLHVLFSLQQETFNLDELLLALIKEYTAKSILTQNQIVEFMDIYSLLIGNDYRRTKLFLRRTEPFISL